MAGNAQRHGISGDKNQGWEFSPKRLSPGSATVAAAGSNSQANATAVTSLLTFISTVSATTRAVKLPLAATGLMAIIFNRAATAAKVYPNTGDKIASAATNAVGAAIAAGKCNIYAAEDATTWRLMVGA